MTDFSDKVLHLLDADQATLDKFKRVADRLLLALCHLRDGNVDDFDRCFLIGSLIGLMYEVDRHTAHCIIQEVFPDPEAWTVQQELFNRLREKVFNADIH